MGEPDAEPNSVFTELTVPAPERMPGGETLPWEVELALDAGMVLRIRRGEPC